MNHVAQAVYDTLQGDLWDPVPGVEDAFADGEPCARWYQDMLDAYGRLCHRLGEKEEDADAEIMIDSLLRIQKELCLRMFEYGTAFASGE